MYATCSIQWLCNGCASTHSRLPLVWRPIRRVLGPRLEDHFVRGVARP